MLDAEGDRDAFAHMHDIIAVRINSFEGISYKQLLIINVSVIFRVQVLEMPYKNYALFRLRGKSILILFSNFCYDVLFTKVILPLESFCQAIRIRL